MSGPRWLVQELTLALILAVHTGVLMVTGGTATLSGQQPTSAGVLSEHEIAALDSMTPQQQAELLVERSINHFVGATTQIERRADNWRGRAEGARLCRRYRLEPETRAWVFQALRDMTGQSLRQDPVAWRQWFNAAGAK